MGPVERAIRAKIPVGTQLRTPSMGAPFRVGQMSETKLYLDLAMAHRTGITWQCLEGAAEELRDKGWVKSAGRHSRDGEPGTLDAYLKEHGPYRDVTNWVAGVLGEAVIADLEIGPPLMLRIKPGALT
jgi:hypothetical protein